MLGFYQRDQEKNDSVRKNGDLVLVFPVDLRIFRGTSLAGLVKRLRPYAPRRAGVSPTWW